MRLNPYHPERFWNHLGRACFVARRYGEAVDALKCITAPDAAQHTLLAACHARLGDDAAAAIHRRLALAQAPDFATEEHLATLHYKQASDREHHRECLIAAGFAP
jgi:adenylate cyclase